jgi:hypothetical protein
MCINSVVFYNVVFDRRCRRRNDFLNDRTCEVCPVFVYSRRRFFLLLCKSGYYCGCGYDYGFDVYSVIDTWMLKSVYVGKP